MPFCAKSNSAPTGGAIYNYAGAHPVLVNTILWGDDGGEIANEPGGNVEEGEAGATLSYCLIDGGCSDPALTTPVST